MCLFVCCVPQEIRQLLITKYGKQYDMSFVRRNLPGKGPVVCSAFTGLTKYRQNHQNCSSRHMQVVKHTHHPVVFRLPHPNVSTCHGVSAEHPAGRCLKLCVSFDTPAHAGQCLLGSHVSQQFMRGVHEHRQAITAQQLYLSCSMLPAR